MCSIWDPSWQGMVMGSLYYYPGNGSGTGSYEMTRKEGRLVRLSLKNTTTGEEMRMILFPFREGETKKQETLPEGDFWTSFSPEDVRTYSQEAGDHNAIHQGSHPIVSGFQLLSSWLADFPQKEAVEMRFFAPVYADENIFISKDGMTGFTDKMCFKVVVKK